jgi:hypothetical protein
MSVTRDLLYELASVGDLPLPQPTQSSAKRERDSDSPISMQSSAGTSTSGRTPARPTAPLPHQHVSVSPPYVDPLYSQHPADAFAQPAPPQPSQNFAYAHLPTHSDELARVPVFQPAAETWLTPQQHRHHHHHQQQQQQHMYAAPTSYGTATTTTTAGGPYTAFVPSSLDPQQQGQQQQQDSGIDMWQTVPTGYEFVFPFTPGAGHHGSALAPWGSSWGSSYERMIG